MAFKMAHQPSSRGSYIHDEVAYSRWQRLYKKRKPSRSRQADTRQLQHSRARGGGPRQTLGHRATSAKHHLQGARSVQGAIHIDCITIRDQLLHTWPAERSESGADVVVFSEAGDQPGREMYDHLQSVQA